MDIEIREREREKKRQGKTGNMNERPEINDDKAWGKKERKVKE